MSLTPAQKATLKAHILANTDPVVVAARAIRNDVALADWYNGDSSFVVWRSSIQPEEYREAITWTEVDALMPGKARIWEWITARMTLPLDATKAGVRQGLADAFDAGTVTRAALIAIAKRNATRAEALFTTGTGTTANPGVAAVEGALHYNTISDMLNAA